MLGFQISNLNFEIRSCRNGLDDCRPERRVSAATDAGDHDLKERPSVHDSADQTAAKLYIDATFFDCHG